MKKFDLDISLNVIHGGVSDCTIPGYEDSDRYADDVKKIMRKIQLSRMKRHTGFRPEDFVLYAVIFKAKDC